MKFNFRILAITHLILLAWSASARPEGISEPIAQCLTESSNPTRSEMLGELAALQNPRTNLGDRLEAMRRLANNKEATAAAIDTLLPYARGVSGESSEEMQASVQAIDAISYRIGSYPVRFPSKVPRTDDQDIIAHEPIRSIEYQGGGNSASYAVLFENGRRGLFKDRKGEFNYRFGPVQSDFVCFNRETCAPSIVERFLGNKKSRSTGQSTIILPSIGTVVLKREDHAYGVGSLQLYVDGFTDVESLNHRNPSLWEQIRHKPEWGSIQTRIQIIDFILGNHDRLPLEINYRMDSKNFMIKIEGVDVDSPDASHQLANIPHPKISVALIDNAMGRPGIGQFDINSFGHFPVRDNIPADLNQSIMHFDEAAFRAEYVHVLPQRGIDDLIGRVHAAQNRIEHGP